MKIPFNTLDRQFYQYQDEYEKKSFRNFKKRLVYFRARS